MQMLAQMAATSSGPFNLGPLPPLLPGCISGAPHAPTSPTLASPPSLTDSQSTEELAPGEQQHLAALAAGVLPPAQDPAAWALLHSTAPGAQLAPPPAIGGPDRLSLPLTMAQMGALVQGQAAATASPGAGAQTPISSGVSFRSPAMSMRVHVEQLYPGPQTVPQQNACSAHAVHSAAPQGSGSLPLSPAPSGPRPRRPLPASSPGIVANGFVVGSLDSLPQEQQDRAKRMSAGKAPPLELLLGGAPVVDPGAAGLSRPDPAAAARARADADALAELFADPHALRRLDSLTDAFACFPDGLPLVDVPTTAQGIPPPPPAAAPIAPNADAPADDAPAGEVPAPPPPEHFRSSGPGDIITGGDETGPGVDANENAVQFVSPGAVMGGSGGRGSPGRSAPSVPSSPAVVLTAALSPEVAAGAGDAKNHCSHGDPAGMTFYMMARPGGARSPADSPSAPRSLVHTTAASALPVGDCTTKRRLVV